MVERLDWTEAILELQRLVPGASDFGSPDRIAGDAGAVAGPVEWRELPNWEQMEDGEILDVVYRGITPPTGNLILVPDHVLFRSRLPVRIRAELVREYVANHWKSEGACFFDGDVVIVAPEARTLTIFHHEGALGLTRCPQGDFQGFV